MCIGERNVPETQFGHLVVTVFIVVIGEEKSLGQQCPQRTAGLGALTYFLSIQVGIGIAFLYYKDNAVPLAFFHDAVVTQVEVVQTNAVAFREETTVSGIERICLEEGMVAGQVAGLYVHHDGIVLHFGNVLIS